MFFIKAYLAIKPYKFKKIDNAFIHFFVIYRLKNTIRKLLKKIQIKCFKYCKVLSFINLNTKNFRILMKIYNRIFVGK